MKRALLGRTAGPVALCSLIATTVVFCQSATAQTAQGATDQTAQNTGDQTAQNTSDQTATGALQEVVVTAERREANIQTTPISIVAISGDQLATSSVTDLNALQGSVPNLTVQNLGGSFVVNIRGIGLEENAGAPDQSGVLVVRDGLPTGLGGFGLNAPYYDIADVEVLRGPQGTFAGDNSTAGSVNVNSQSPNFRGIDGYVDALAGTYSDTRFQGAVNLPVDDTLALRFAFNEETRNSFYNDEGSAYYGSNGAGPLLADGAYADSPKTSNDPGDLNEKDGRLGVLWKPTDNFQALTKIEIDAQDTDGQAGQPNAGTFTEPAGQLCPNGAAGPVCHSVYYEGYSGSPYTLTQTQAEAGVWDMNTDYFSEELRFTLPDGVVLRSMSGDQELFNVSTGGNYDSIWTGYSTGDTTTHIYSEEFDAISPTDRPISWIAGANWYYVASMYSSFSANEYTPFSPTDPEYSYWVDGETIYDKNEAAFGQITWQATPTLQAYAGARVTHDADTGVGKIQINAPGIGLLLTLGNTQPYTGTTPTGKVGLNWTPVAGQFFYAFYARGYKPGEENLGSEPPANRETVNDYEAGWKGTLARGHVQMSLGGYYMQYYGMIEPIFDPEDAAATSEGNIPYSTVKGLEYSMQSNWGRLGFDLGAALNKSVLGQIVEYSTYAFPPGYEITNQCAPGETPNPTKTCTNYTPYYAPVSGEALPFAPLFSGHATVQYSIPVGSTSVVPRAVYSFQGTSYSSLFQNSYFRLPEHSLVNAYLDWDAGPWTTTLWATNVANKVYIQGISGAEVYYGNPRQYGVELHRSF